MDPKNKDGLEITRLTSSTSDDAEWVGGFFAHGGDGAERSTVIWFAVPPGKRLGKHTDTAEETQFILAGSGESARRLGRPAGDVVCSPRARPRPAQRGGDLEVIGFSAPASSTGPTRSGSRRSAGNGEPETRRNVNQSTSRTRVRSTTRPGGLSLRACSAPGPGLGAKQMGTSVYEIPPGQALCPYHYEYAEEEWLLVLDRPPDRCAIPTARPSSSPGTWSCSRPAPPAPTGSTTATDEPVRVMM